MDEDENMCCYRPPKMPLKSQRLRNPFLLKIDAESLKIDNYEAGITMNIVCECSFWLFSFWAVKIKEFHEKLAYDWITIKNQLLDNQLITRDIAHYTNDPEIYQDEYNKIVHKIKAPETFDSSFFRETPRDRYPLAIILLLNDRDIADQLEGNDIVLLASIVHLKDALVPVETSILAQYIKRKSGLVLNLQDLYVCSEQNEDHMPYCVICLDNHITRAFLPCKHACVCSVCLEKINTCPLCRCPIQSFILINQPISTNRTMMLKSQEENQQHQSDESPERENILQKIQKFFTFK